MQTLLHLMAWNDDTNLVSRGGFAGLNFVQQGGAATAVAGGVADGGLEALRQFDDELIARHLARRQRRSAGGDLVFIRVSAGGFPL